MSKTYDRAWMTTATTGTGTITLGAAQSGYQSFAAAGAVNGDSLSYVIIDGTAWEIGIGTYTSSGTLLSRVLTSSSTGSLISLSGSATVFLAPTSLQNPVLKAPTVTQYLTGSGTYTPPAGALYLRIRMMGGGAGGCGSGSGSPGKGTAGGNTTFGTSLLTAPGAPAPTSTTAAGAAASVATGGNILNLPGTPGAASQSGFTNSQGTQGGMGPFGGAPFPNDGAAVASVPNTGAGGNGAGSSGTASPGSSASSGAYLEHLLANPTGTYAYAVGANGTGGIAGTSGSAGAAGGSGVILIEEYYN